MWGKCLEAPTRMLVVTPDQCILVLQRFGMHTTRWGVFATLRESVIAWKGSADKWFRVDAAGKCLQRVERVCNPEAGTKRFRHHLLRVDARGHVMYQTISANSSRAVLFSRGSGTIARVLY